MSVARAPRQEARISYLRVVARTSRPKSTVRFMMFYRVNVMAASGLWMFDSVMERNGKM